MDVPMVVKNGMAYGVRAPASLSMAIRLALRDYN